jgi:hypothetical protein
VRREAPLFAAAAALTGCADARAPPDERSEYVDLYVDDGIRVCGGTLDSYDRFIERAFETWAEREPGEFRVRVIVDPDVCGETLGGCTVPGTSRVKIADSQYHELTHAVVLDIDGSSVKQLGEAVATSFGWAVPGVIRPDVLQGVELGEFVSETERTALLYGVGGPYMRFLLDTYGTQDVRAYYRRMHEVAVDHTPSFDDFAKEFEPIFDQSLEDAWSTFVAAPRCDHGLWYCDTLEPVSLPFAVDQIDCDDKGSLGFSDDPLLPGGHYRAERLVQLAEQEAVDVIVRYANVSVRVLWCGECAEQGDFEDWFGESLTPRERMLSLHAGVKVFWVHHHDPSAPMVFEVRRAG